MEHRIKDMDKLNIVLYEPEIPQNTGNIVRTCAATGAALHLIRPLGFSMEDRYLKRAGLDYWDLVNIFTYENLDDFFRAHPNGHFAFLTKHAERTYDAIRLSSPLFLIFGKETAGIPAKILFEQPDNCYRIPMADDARSLNLSNAAAIVIYDVLRRIGFTGLKQEGKPPSA